MSDKEKNAPIEKKIALVDDWINKFAESGEVEQLEQGVLKEVLEKFGANFDDQDSEERRERLLSLSKYSNAKRGSGMRAVWGEEKFGKKGEFNLWANRWAVKYMKETRKKLPKLEQKSKTKKDGDGNPIVNVYYNSGMVAFAGDITSYASGNIDLDTFKGRSEARHFNGKLFQKEQRIKKIKRMYRRVEMIDVVEKDGNITEESKKIRPSSFPPEYPIAAWEQLKTFVRK